MRFRVLATDYDGTLAHGARVDAPTLAALERLKASGRKLVLVTGRVLPELLQVCPRVDLFDLAVIENGAVLYSPQAGTTRVLVPPPPPGFAADLRRRGVHPVGAGEVIVATFQPHQDVVAAAIREAGLELDVIMNKDAVMVLPSGVNKGTGLSVALAELGIAAEHAVGVGDAENDHPLLEACGYGAAVANALDELKAAAHLVTNGARGAGVAELIDLMLADALPLPRRG